MNREQTKKLSTRQQQKIKVLINKPDFIKAILKLRVKWNIPEKGLKHQKEIDNWHQQLEQDTRNFIEHNWAWKKEGLQKIKEGRDHSKHNSLLDDFNHSIPRNALLRDIKALVKEFKLSPRWVRGINRYLLTNDPDTLGIFIGPVISTSVDFEFDTQVISIEIDADTTLNDIKAIWPSVKSAQKNLRYKTQDKFQPFRQFERNKKAYELQQQGLTYEKIAKELSSAKKEYGYEDVGKMIERYKRKVDIN